MAIKQIIITVTKDAKPPYGTTTGIDIKTDTPNDQVRGVHALAILNDAMQQIIEQMAK